MIKLIPKKYSFDRRSFISRSSKIGFFTLLLQGFSNRSFSQDAGKCNESSETNTLVPKPSDDLLVWVDGLFLDNRSNVKVNASISMYLPFIQKAESFIEKVFILDNSANILGARFYDSSDQMSGGNFPYVIFENLEIDSNSSYEILYQIKNGSNIELFRYTLNKPIKSRLNTDYLPQLMRDDFSVFIGSNPGFITSPYEFYTDNSLALHSARGTVKDIGSDGTFRVDIELMHGDANQGHFMRYFIVTDPVGRILGALKRTFGQTPNTSVNGQAAMIVSQISESDRKNIWKIPQDQVGNINDCPYIQIFTEDVFDALARSTIRLR